MWGRWDYTKRRLRRRAELAETNAASLRAELHAAYAARAMARDENRRLRESLRGLNEAIEALKASRAKLDAYVETMRAVFAEVRRVLAPDGTLWLNIGDSYAASVGQGSAGPSTGLEGGGRPSFRRDGAPAAAPRRTAVGLPAKNLLGMSQWWAPPAISRTK